MRSAQTRAVQGIAGLILVSSVLMGATVTGQGAQAEDIPSVEVTSSPVVPIDETPAPEESLSPVVPIDETPAPEESLKPVVPIDETPAPIEDTKPDLTVVALQSFDHAVTVSEAIDLAKANRLDAAAVRIENPTVSAEYSLTDGLSLEEFHKWFLELYGTEPQAVGIQAHVPAMVAELPADVRSRTLDAKLPFLVPATEPKVIVTGLKEFVAAEPLGGEASIYFDRSTASKAPSTGTPVTMAVPASVSWAPTIAEIRVERVGSRQYFYQFASWQLGADADNGPVESICEPWFCGTARWGMEFGVDLYNDLLSTNIRPFCAANESAFLATNETYTWGVTQGPTPIMAATNAYADHWEIADSCNKNAFAIGLANPWNIPNNSNGFEQILVSINAPLGFMNQSELGGTITLNDNIHCQLLPGATLQQCMGDALRSPSAPFNSGRPTLDTTRNWVAAPNKCWITPNSGTSSVALSIPFDSDGCF